MIKSRRTFKKVLFKLKAQTNHFFLDPVDENAFIPIRI